MSITVSVVFRRPIGAEHRQLAAICASPKVAHRVAAQLKEEARIHGLPPAIWEIHPWTVTDFADVDALEDLPRVVDDDRPDST